MKKVTFINSVGNILPDGLNIICIEENEYVCTDQTATLLRKLIPDDCIAEDMSSEEFESLPSFVQDSLAEEDVVPSTDEELDRLFAEMDEKIADLDNKTI